ncbi:hypothetical protein [Herpetosiphon giganteus]|uniref:hypothetical protein n=1 Tax=Herpetosiphon giganteus TaxID=2029754 RepID=UPI00195AF45A|nr:hypothetical protein [Herpetosiphon giganteus]MBM7841973.1 hypothetical protein [Herpetosiphon giganteus]
MGYGLLAIGAFFGEFIQFVAKKLNLCALRVLCGSVFNAEAQRNDGYWLVALG